jgi:hypothetical protein
VARTVFMHLLAFNEQLKGLSPEHLRYAVSVRRLTSASSKLPGSALFGIRHIWTTFPACRCAF